MSDAELQAFEDVLDELGEGTDQTPEEIDAVAKNYSMPDPLENKPADDS